MDPPAGDQRLLSSCRGAADTGVRIHVQKFQFRWVLGPAMAEALQRVEQSSGAVGTSAACVRLQAEDEYLQAAQAADVGAAGAPRAAPASVRAGDPDARVRRCSRPPIRITSRRTGRRSVPTLKLDKHCPSFRNVSWPRTLPSHPLEVLESTGDPLPPFECWFEIESLEELPARIEDRDLDRAVSR